MPPPPPQGTDPLQRLRHEYFRNGTVPVVYPSGFKVQRSQSLVPPPPPSSPEPKVKTKTDVTLLERGLLLVVFVLSILCGLVVLLLLRASSMEASISRGDYPNNGTARSLGARSGRLEFRAAEICYTPECIHASSTILRSMDSTADPCSDFYQYSCGRWNHFNVLTPDMSGLDTLTLLKNEMRRVFKELLEAPTTKEESHSTRQAKLLYRSCLNETNMERYKEKPVLKLLESLGLVWPVLTSGTNKSLKFDEGNFDWIQVLIQIRLLKLDSLFMLLIGPDQKNSSASILQVDQIEPLVPSVDLGSPRGRRQIEAYHTMMVYVAEMMGANRTKALQEMKEVVMFEIRLRSFLDPAEKRRNYTSLYNRLTLKELAVSLPDMKLRHFASSIFKTNFSESEHVIVYSPSYLNKLHELMKVTPKRTVANFLSWRVVFFFMNFLDKRFVNLRQRYTNIITGTTHPVPRWRTCVTIVNYQLGMVTGSMFIKKYYSLNMKTSAEAMIRDIREAFLEQLDDVDWMDEATKTLARHKTLMMESKVAFPQYILDPKKLDNETKVSFDENDAFGNILRLNRFRHQLEVERVGRPNDKQRWLTPPGTVNAFYTRTGNFITLPAAMLQPPMFHPSYPMAKNYGGIGVVIGHEITHGFDDKGRQFDQHGNLKQWWQPEALEKFKAKAQCMIDQYSKYRVPEVNLFVNGFKTQGENIADNGGIKQAFKAFRKRQNSVDSNLRIRLPGVNLTDDQLFFLTYAQIWCGSATLEKMAHDVRFNDHAAARFRVIGALSNSEEFANAFRCPTSSPMNPKKKCKVW